MIKSVKVFTNNSKFDYVTSVNFWQSKKAIESYFIGNTFFFGSCDSQESDPNYWATVTHVEVLPVNVKVISGTFEGTTGELKAGLSKGLFHVRGCLVTCNQIEVLS